jgi:hypothetical protein
LTQLLNVCNYASEGEGWLVGNTDTELNTNTLNRIRDIDKLNEKDKELVFEFLDSFISNRKIKKALN